MSELRAEVEKQIRDAFAGVTLGTGVSLRQAEAIDNHFLGFTHGELAALALPEVTEDWSKVPMSEIERDCIAHLDGEGLRYYLPALLLNLLDHYDEWSDDMWVIGTIGAIAPLREFWDDQMWLSSHLDDAQRSAVAVYLTALPKLVDLEPDDATPVADALRDYWARFLPDGGDTRASDS